MDNQTATETTATQPSAMMGVVSDEVGRPYVIATYSFTWVVLLGYGLTLILRARK